MDSFLEDFVAFLDLDDLFLSEAEPLSWQEASVLPAAEEQDGVAPPAFWQQAG